MFTERFAIQQRMSEIKDERRQLNEEYYRLLERLRQLDEKSAIGEEGTDVSGLAAKLSDAVTQLSSLMPTVSVEQVIENIKREHNAADYVIKDEPKNEAPKIDRVSMDNAKQRDKRKGRITKLTPIEAAPTVASIIKEKGEVKASDIKLEMEMRGTPITDIYGTLSRVMETNKNIVKGGFGIYKHAKDDTQDELNFNVVSAE